MFLLQYIVQVRSDPHQVTDKNDRYNMNQYNGVPLNPGMTFSVRVHENLQLLFAHSE
jgi:hypothetical protein